MALGERPLSGLEADAFLAVGTRGLLPPLERVLVSPLKKAVIPLWERHSYELS